jgi:hypothetical protein
MMAVQLGKVASEVQGKRSPEREASRLIVADEIREARCNALTTVGSGDSGRCMILNDTSLSRLRCVLLEMLPHEISIHASQAGAIPKTVSFFCCRVGPLLAGVTLQTTRTLP